MPSLDQTSLESQFNFPLHHFIRYFAVHYSRNFCFVPHRRMTGRAQDVMDQGIRSAQKAATSAVADAAAREVEKQISAGFGALMKKK